MSEFELYDRHVRLEQSRTFIIAILHEAYKREDAAQIAEFSAKLEEKDREINKLMAEA